MFAVRERYVVPGQWRTISVSVHFSGNAVYRPPSLAGGFSVHFENGGSELQDLWTELERELRGLRTVFEPSAEGKDALRFFDEYLSANEFGLALETLCDFLLDSDATAISGSLLMEIQHLHTKMGVNDYCVRNLRQKASSGPNAS